MPSPSNLHAQRPVVNAAYLDLQPETTCVRQGLSWSANALWRKTDGRGHADAGEGEALGRLTSASPYSSIKVSNTSLDHLLLGKAADRAIIRLYFPAGQIFARERYRLTGNRERVSEKTVYQKLATWQPALAANSLCRKAEQGIVTRLEVHGGNSGHESSHYGRRSDRVLGTPAYSGLWPSKTEISCVAFRPGDDPSWP